MRLWAEGKVRHTHFSYFSRHRFSIDAVAAVQTLRARSAFKLLQFTVKPPGGDDCVPVLFVGFLLFLAVRP